MIYFVYYIHYKTVELLKKKNHELIDVFDTYLIEKNLYVTFIFKYDI